MDLGALIRRRRKELGLSQAKLAELCGVSRAAVGLWETNETSPTRTHAPAVARALQLDVGAISPLLSQSLVVVDTDSDGRTIPFMGWDAFVSGAPVKPRPTIWVGSDVPRDAVAMRVPDESMAPDFHANDIIGVSRSTQAKRGDVVVAELDGHGILRKYMPRGQDSSGAHVFDLLSTSPDWPTITVNSSNPGKVLAVVVAHWRTLNR